LLAIHNGGAVTKESDSAERPETERHTHFISPRQPSVSVLIPALNEARTISALVRKMKSDPWVLEVVVIDDGSIDGTPGLASQAGAQVVLSSMLGKGTSMEDGLRASSGDTVLFLDGDLLEICPDLVHRMTAPIRQGQADMVKAKFSRDAGRVTLLTARPLLSAFFPELARFDQPLGGIVAARRALLRNIHLENDYGVDVGLLIDSLMKGARILEVDIGRIDHESQTLPALAEMAKQVARVIIDRAWRERRLSINHVRDMEETERRAQAQLLPTTEYHDDSGKFALLDMDGVLLDGRFVVELAERVGARWELSRFLDSKTLAEEERTAAIASLFAGVSQDIFHEVAMGIPLTPDATDAVIALRREGYRVGIVTDSFDIAAETVRRRVFADFRIAHVMSFRRRIATGEVTLSPAMLLKDGCPQHRCCKGNAVRRLKETAGLVPQDSLAVGDSENDICMLRAVGTPVAFRPTVLAVAEAARYTIARSLNEILELPGVVGSDGSRSQARTDPPAYPGKECRRAPVASLPTE
jgi:HAD superfamily phosphoserine phosphatase-like hydrolase